MVLGKKEAESLGLAATDPGILGSIGKVIKDGVEVASGEIVRVLRGICFSGCGFVKNPANPASVVLETANTKAIDSDDKTIVLNYDELQTVGNKVTYPTVEDTVPNIEKSTNDTIGICVSYKRRLYDKNEAVTETDWCTLYEEKCTSFSRDTTDPDCLRYKEELQIAKAMIEKKFNDIISKNKRKNSLYDLQAALCEAVKSKSR